MPSASGVRTFGPRLVAGGPEIPATLIQAQERGEMVFFCGAGISIPTGLPDFAGLVNQVYSALHVAREPAEETAFARGKFDEVLGLLEDRLTPNAMRAEVARILSLAPDPESLRLHRALLEVSRNTSGVRLVTTNYDDNFRCADSIAGLRFDAGPHLPDVRHWDSVLHLHGRLKPPAAEADLSRLVLTKADFGNAYLYERWAARFVADLLESYTVVFVGYSLGDMVIEYLMTAVTDRPAARRPYALAGYSSREEADERASKWKQSGVQPILYDSRNGHQLLVETVEEWARLSGDPHGYRVQVATSGLVSAPDRDTHEADPDRVVWALTDSAAAWPAFNRIARHPVPGPGAAAWLQEFAVRGLLGGTVNPTPHERGPAGPVITDRAERQMLQTDSVADSVAYWIEIHAHDPDVFRWVIHHGRNLHFELRRRLWDRLTSKDRDLPEIPERLTRLWTLLLAEPPEDYEFLLRLARILANSSRQAPPAAEDILLRLLRPRLAVFPGPAPYRALPAGSTPKEIALLECGHTDVVLGCRDQHHRFNVVAELQPRRYPDFLRRNAAVLTSYLQSAFQLLKASDRADAPYARSLLIQKLGDGEPAVPKKGPTNHAVAREGTGRRRFAESSFGSWTVLLEWVAESYHALQERDKGRGDLLRRWAASAEPMLWILALQAIARDVSADFELVRTLILAKPGEVLWDETCAPHVLTILEQAGQRGSPEFQDDLVEAVQRKAPPDALEPESDGATLAKVGRRLAALHSGGVTLAPQASATLAAFERRRRAAAEGMSQTEAAVPRGHIRDIVAAVTTGTVDVDAFRTFAERRPAAAMIALRELGRGDNWPGELWQETLTVVATKVKASKQGARRNRRLAEAVLAIPDHLFAELSFSVADLVDSLAESGCGDDDGVFWSLWDRGWEGRSQESGLPTARDALTYSMNTTAGTYAGAALKRIRATTGQGANSIVAAQLSRLDTIVGDETGSAGLVMLVFWLDWLYWHAPDWTAKNILPRMRWDGTSASDRDSAETHALWQVLALRGQVSRELLEALGADLWTAVQRNRELRHGKGLVRFFVHVSMQQPELIDESVRRETARSAIQDNVRQVGVALADALDKSEHPRERVWRESVRPWLQSYWPREAALNTAESSAVLVEVIMQTGDEFPDAVDWGNGYLMPLDDQQVGRVWYGKNVWKAHPRAAVALLHRIVGRDRIDPFARAALSEMVKTIKELEPTITADSRFVDLEKRAAR